ncbi:MAG: hypothetical protein KIT58_23480, partial [Planctomycetota bacterium]|nr:hypothetical protein [Planctomycetota bacterium]
RGGLRALAVTSVAAAAAAGTYHSPLLPEHLAGPTRVVAAALALLGAAAMAGVGLLVLAPAARSRPERPAT